MDIRLGWYLSKLFSLESKLETTLLLIIPSFTPIIKFTLFALALVTTVFVSPMDIEARACEFGLYGYFGLTNN